MVYKRSINCINVDIYIFIYFLYDSLTTIITYIKMVLEFSKPHIFLCISQNWVGKCSSITSQIEGPGVAEGKDSVAFHLVHN